MLPNELLHIVLEYYGRIKYHKGQYIDIIHKHDKRYKMLYYLFQRKVEFMKKIEIDCYGFYFEICFDKDKSVGLCYEYIYSQQYQDQDQFKICYFDIRDVWNWKLIPTFI
jgi:hypothetical protein